MSVNPTMSDRQPKAMIDAFINQGLPIAIGIMGFRLVG
jgi:hypothetical protein